MAESVSDLMQLVEDIGPRLRDAAISEIREYLAAALVHIAEGGVGVLDVAGPGGALPDFECEDSFLAGVRYAAQLVGDREFDF